jgi:ketosteroid isomerase-like protein
MLTEQRMGVVILSKNGESRLRYDAVLEIKADGAWKVRHELVADTPIELHDLSC